MSESLVLDQITATARRAPHRVALVWGDERVSYGDLLGRANRLAAYLTSAGLGAEAPIGVAIEPSPWAVVAILAVMQAGGVYVPLDPAYPGERLRYMIDAARTQLVLTSAAAAHTVESLAPKIIELDADWDRITRDVPSSPERSIDPRALAYVIFTSGSTGRPKGVLVSHRGIANLVAAQVETFHIREDSTVLAYAPLSFDASVSEIFTALAAGATLCLAPRDDLVPGPRLANLVARHRVTVATLPPSALAILDPNDFPTLETVVSAGEACSRALVARWAPRCRFVNAYGPTEVTVCATMGECRADDPPDRPPAIGGSLPNCTVHVLDAALREVAEGSEGELYVGGIGVARGYLALPALTAERFVPDPFAAEPGGRMYRTGDRVLRGPDGKLEFIGRCDDQIKLRGYRVEPAEIEAVLRELPAIRDALVLAREVRAGDVRLVAYVVASLPFDVNQARARAAAQLPHFSQPTHYLALDRWPVSPTGKIDRQQLPLPEIKTATIVATAARSELEYRLIAIWEDILATEVGPDDDFFALGGHSLLAIRLLQRINAELGCDLPLSAVLQRRTPSGLAAAIHDQGGEVRLTSPVSLRPHGDRAPLFLVPPVHGSGLCYLPLVDRLGDERPVLAFQAPGLDGRTPALEDLGQLAAHYIGELLAIHPSGPFVLAGWSNGGAIAFEMALQLESAGRSVPELLLIDAAAPTPYMVDGVKQRYGELGPAAVAFLYVRNFGLCFGLDLGVKLTDFEGLSADAIDEAAVARLRRVPAFAPELGPADMRARMAVFGGTARAFLAWHPSRRFGGRVIMFLARDGHPDFSTARHDWSAFVERTIEVHEVSGSHFSIVHEPHVDTLATEMRRVLERVG